MSTSINVSVDRGGLLQRNRQQIIANRQSELDRSGTEQAVATGAEQREQRLAALGVTETGAPAGSSVTPQLEKQQQPGAYRRGNTIGVSIGWVFQRNYAAQPVYFERQPEHLKPCGESYNYGRFAITGGPLVKVRSADGSVEQSFTATYDLSPYVSRPGDGADLSIPSTAEQPAYTTAPPITERLGPTNYSPSDLARITGWEAWLPVGPNAIIYVYRRKRIDGVQFLTSQYWRQCSYSSNTRINYYGLTTPKEVVSIQEKCFLIGQNAVTELTVPTALRSLLETTQPQWSVTSNQNRLVDHSTLPNTKTYYEGAPTTSNQYISGWQWNYVAPTQSLQTLFEKKGQYYQVTEPLPAGYTLATAGVFRSLLNAPMPQKVPPAVTNVNDAMGFGSGDTWQKIYEAATVLKHQATSNNQSVKANKIFRNANPKPWPTDSLLYESEEGFVFNADWQYSVGLGYDWGKSLTYCLPNLLALGFTAPDLTP